MSCVCSASWSIPQSSKPLKPPKLPQLAAIARRPMHPVLSSLLYITLPLHYNTLHYNRLDCKAPCIPFFLHYGPMQAKPGHWSPARWWWDENWERVHLPPKMHPPPHPTTPVSGSNANNGVLPRQWKYSGRTTTKITIAGCSKGDSKCLFWKYWALKWGAVGAYFDLLFNCLTEQVHSFLDMTIFLFVQVIPHEKQEWENQRKLHMIAF